MSRRRVLPGLILAAVLVAGPAVLLAPGAAPRAELPPAPAPAALGQAIAERDCASCHAIGAVGESPLEGAPRWRDLHTRFPVEDLAEGLAEGIVVGHEAMPAKAYEPADVEALIAYLKSLEPAGAAK